MPGAVTCGGDAVASMGGRCVDGREVEHALANALQASPRGGDFVVTGPTIDGEELGIVVRLLGDHLFVSDVIL